MRIRIRRSVLVTISICIMCSVFFSSCKKTQDKKEIVPIGDRTTFVYSSVCAELVEPGYYTYLKNAMYSDGLIYCITQEYAVDLSSIQNYIYVLTSEGEIKSKTPISNEINVYASMSLDNNLLRYATMGNKVEALDIDSGKVVDFVRLKYSPCGVVNCEDGYVVMSIGRVDKYDKDNNLVSTIENDEWQMYDGSKAFYEDGGKSYLISNYKYYELDFNSRSSKLVFDTFTTGRVTEACSGQYLFNEEGEFYVDCDNSCLVPITYWNEMLLQPNQYGYSQTKYIGIDDEHFIQVFSYDNGVSQLLYYTYESDQNYNDRISLVIGGFNCRNDETLNWAVYMFNKSQSDYRAYIEDYSYEFGWDSTSTAANQYAELIQYFNEGNAPDIFYGPNFDYDELAENGMTVEISQYMSDDFKKRMNMITPNIKDLMYEDGKCFSVFAGYQMQGYIADYNLIDGKSDLTIDEVLEIATTKSIAVGECFSANELAVESIRCYASNNSQMSVEDLKDLLEFAIAAGENSNLSLNSTELSKTNVDETLLWYRGVYLIFAYNDYERDTQTRLTYVGYPSVKNSNHPIIPYGEMGISSSTKYPEKCCELMEFLLSDDVQILSTLNCRIPVIDSKLEQFIQYSITPELMSDEEYYYQMYFAYYNPVSEECAEDFLNAIHSADMVIAYDWGMASIIEEELNSYYRNSKDVDSVAESLYSRLKLYLSE